MAEASAAAQAAGGAGAAVVGVGVAAVAAVVLAADLARMWVSARWVQTAQRVAAA